MSLSIDEAFIAVQAKKGQKKPSMTDAELDAVVDNACEDTLG